MKYPMKSQLLMLKTPIKITSIPHLYHAQAKPSHWTIDHLKLPRTLICTRIDHMVGAVLIPQLATSWLRIGVPIMEEYKDEDDDES